MCVCVDFIAKDQVTQVPEDYSYKVSGDKCLTSVMAQHYCRYVHKLAGVCWVSCDFADPFLSKDNKEVTEYRPELNLT